MIKKEQWVDVDVVGETTEERYIGRFLIKPYLKHEERADAVRLYEKLTRGIDKTDIEKQFLYILAFIQFHIVTPDAPWWTGGLDLYDESPIYELSNKIQEVRGVKKPKDEVVNENP